MEATGDKGLPSKKESTAGAMTMSPGVLAVPLFPEEGTDKLQDRGTASSTEPIWIAERMN